MKTISDAGSRKNQKMRSLSRNLTISLILVVASASIITTFFSYWFLSQRAKTLHEQKSVEYINYLRESLELPMWKMDNDTLDRICRSFSKNDVVALLRVTNEKGDILFEEKSENEVGLVIKSASLTYGDQVIGHVELGLTTRIYEAANYQLLVTSIFTILVVVIGLVMVTEVVLRRLLHRPLNLLIQRIRGIALGKYEESSPVSRSMEFAAILGEFNSMAERVEEREQTLISINRQLEGQITERQLAEERLIESEARFRSYVESAPDGIFVVDEKGCYVDVNKAACGITGYRRDELMEMSIMQLTHPDDHERAGQHFEKVKRIGNASVELRIKTKDGAVRHWIVNAVALSDTRLLGFTKDITENRQMEEQLRHSEKMQAVGQLAGGIAHDFNNMLGIILGYANLLEDALSEQPKLEKYAHAIHHASERGATLTKKMLAFSRQKRSDAGMLNINTLLQDGQHMLKKTLTARIKLIFDLTGNLWPVELESSDLEDAIVNMSINAMHAMKEGGKITIRTSNEQLNEMDARTLNLKAGDYVLLSITDTGCGMYETTKEKIFDPFYSTKGEQGTGLGLSQVYGFVERSGGTIKVYSEPGLGSRFALYFPRSHRTITEAQTPVIDAVPKLQGSETLLVVDDEQAMVELAHNILTAQGYRVLTANDGEQALDILEKETVDLMITDVIMPNMDGYKLATQVQQRYPHIKIQMVSGFADDRHNGLADDSPYRNMLYKPYASNTLLVRVRSLLDGGSTKDKLAGRTILVMDDDDEVRELFQIHLSKLGCKIIEACDSEEAIALYQQSLEGDVPIDAMIMDLSIPGGMGGKDVAAKILAMDPHAKLIVTSGHSEGPEMTEYQDYGFCGALEKSFNRGKIKQVLEQALSTS